MFLPTKVSTSSNSISAPMPWSRRTVSPRPWRAARCKGERPSKSVGSTACGLEMGRKEDTLGKHVFLIQFLITPRRCCHPFIRTRTPTPWVAHPSINRVMLSSNHEGSRNSHRVIISDRQNYTRSYLTHPTRLPSMETA